MIKDMQSPESGPGRSAPADRSASVSPTERELWIHEFRNALGNITIATSAVRFELADHQYEHTPASIRLIEEGCERCLRLLHTMPI